MASGGVGRLIHVELVGGSLGWGWPRARRWKNPSWPSSLPLSPCPVAPILRTFLPLLCWPFLHLLCWAFLHLFLWAFLQLLHWPFLQILRLTFWQLLLWIFLPLPAGPSSSSSIGPFARSSRRWCFSAPRSFQVSRRALQGLLVYPPPGPSCTSSTGPCCPSSWSVFAASPFS